MKESLKQFLFYLIIKYRTLYLPDSDLDVFDSKIAGLIREILKNNNKLTFPLEENVTPINDFNVINRHVQIYKDLFPDAPSIMTAPVLPSLKMMASREVNKLTFSHDMLESILSFFKPRRYKTNQEKFIDKLKSKVKALGNELQHELDLYEPGYYFEKTLPNNETTKLHKEFFHKLLFFGTEFTKYNQMPNAIDWPSYLFKTLIAAYKQDNINYSCFLNITSLHWACVLGDEFHVNQIVAAGANVNALCSCRSSKNIQGIWGKATPLYLASWYGNSAMIQCLLKAQADPNLMCAGNQTAIHKAAEHNSVEVIELLLNAGANHTLRASINYSTENLTPFDCALLNNNLDTASYFLNKRLVSYLKMTKPPKGKFLYLRCQPLLKEEKYRKNLIKAISFQADDKEFKCIEGTYLYDLIKNVLLKEKNLERDVREKLEVLIATTVPNENSKSLPTPQDATPQDVIRQFIEAVKQDEMDLVKKLLSEGVDVNVTYGKVQSTALHWAAIYGHIEMVKYLVANGANSELTDSNGQTALQWAEEAAKECDISEEKADFDPIIKYLKSTSPTASSMSP